MKHYIVYLYETESQFHEDVNNLRSFTVCADDEGEAMTEALELMEVYEQYDGYNVHSIKELV
jgi:uncharacterized protein YwgA